jgi:cytochrome bd-type quinol oxidase subunit 2
MSKKPSTDKNLFANNIEHGSKDDGDEHSAKSERYFILAIIGLIVAFMSPLIGTIIAFIAYKKSDPDDQRARNAATAGMLVGAVLFVATVLSLIFDPSLFNSFKNSL